MNFTPKLNARTAVSGILTIAVVGLISSVSHTVPPAGQIVTRQDAYAVGQSFQTERSIQVVPAVERGSAAALQTARPYQPISSWYRNKHWWKRNAPIVGGAGGGALVGGLVGGGKGALIGGAIGGGGGYLYKRSRHHHEYYHHH